MAKLIRKKKKLSSPLFIRHIHNRNWETTEQKELEQLVKDIDNKNTREKNSK